MPSLRDCLQSDLPRVSELNERVVPAVNSLTLDELEDFLQTADYFRVAEQDGQVVAFLVGLREGHHYTSINYRWFLQQFERFAYIDRVAVDESARRGQLATTLYADFAERCGRQAGRLVCEVNIRPANEVSLRFHERQGFRQVGEQDTEGGTKRVALMQKELGK